MRMSLEEYRQHCDREAVREIDSYPLTEILRMLALRKVDRCTRCGHEYCSLCMVSCCECDADFTVKDSFISPLGYEHAITIGWNEHNARRHELIEAKRSRLLSESESAELAELQWLAGIKRELQTGPTAANDFNVGVYIDQD